MFFNIVNRFDFFFSQGHNIFLFGAVLVHIITKTYFRMRNYII